MKLLVLGASGGTGRELVRQALELGHEVTAFVRNPQKLPITHARLRLAIGDVLTHPTAVDEAVRGQEVVVSSLGVRRPLPGGLFSRSMPTIVSAMQRHAVKRLIVVSSFGVGETARGASLLQRFMYRVLLGEIYADKLASEDFLIRSDLDWTIVYPVLLTNGPRTGRYRTGERLPMRGVAKIARADVAHLIVTQLVQGAFIRQRVVISQ
jgi:putative NADH-flavin reductase